jgi:acetyl-CoA acetyltransferase
MKSEQEIGHTAIIGFGATEITRDPTRGIGSYAVDAIRAAIQDSGVDRSEIDGYVGAPQSSSNSSKHWDGGDEISSNYVLSSIGLRPSWSSDTSGLALGMVAAARGALMAGMSRYVLGVRALYHRRGDRYSERPAHEVGGTEQFTLPYGFGPAGGRHAQWLRQYNDRNGANREDLFSIVRAAHKHARLNPRAYWRDSTLDLETYLSSRWIAEPLSLYDCDLPVTGACAFVMTTVPRAKKLGKRYAIVTSMSNNNRPRGALDDAGLVASDIDVCQLYDGFSCFPYVWYEALGFCPEGKAHRFVRDGTIELGGQIPTNTFGGSLGEGRLHGIGHLYEGYLQVTGRAERRQIQDAEVCVVQVGAPDRSWLAVLTASG